MELKTLAAEMKSQAEAMPMTIERLMEGVASKSFPAQLKRIETIDGIGPVQVQYSHDHILGPSKFIEHLSFSRGNQERPSAEIQRAFQEAFFDNKDVDEIPSTWKHVIQMARLVVVDVRNN
jgi:hypothetical protein